MQKKRFVGIQLDAFEREQLREYPHIVNRARQLINSVRHDQLGIIMCLQREFDLNRSKAAMFYWMGMDLL